MHVVRPRILPEQPGKRFLPRSRRRILCVFPRYSPSFGTFQYAYPLMPGVRAFMPPQGLLVMAAYLPRQWEVRFVDENVRPASDRDYQWADAVLISGMHVQRWQILAINRNAHRHGKLTVLGGPSVSACPEQYSEVDFLHLGELGDATDELIVRLDHCVRRPAEQRVFETTDRLPLKDFPLPAYHLIDLRRYFLGSVQFSSGCPYMCEFCDIPALYGRNPRLKNPEQVVAELDAMLACGLRGAVYFVDDNFIANRNAAVELLPHLVKWQRDRGYPIEFACEATLNISQCTDLLKQMREARFTTVFCGIETPEPEALRAMKKKQNLRSPILGSVKTLNDHGMEVVSGIIMGLDTDTPKTADQILEFIDHSRIPMLTINLLYALPKTPLYDRLLDEGRITDDPTRESNVIFAMPSWQVQRMWLRCISEAYEPSRLLERFSHQCETTYRNRLEPRRKLSAGVISFGLRTVQRVLWQCAVRNDWRSDFRRVAWPLLRTGRVEDVTHMGIVAHHLVKFTRQCQNGQSESCFYAPREVRVSSPNVLAAR